MKVLQAKKYNEHMTQRWLSDWDKAKSEGRDWSMMPQLAFYISSKNYGYWAFNDKVAIWGKTKSIAIQNFNKR